MERTGLRRDMLDVLPDALVRIGGHGLSKVVPFNGLNDTDNLFTPNPNSTAVRIAVPAALS